MLTPEHIELYCRIKSDPFRHAGLRIDAAVIFCEIVEQRLAKLDVMDRVAIVLRACGYSQREIADQTGQSVGGLFRRLKVADNVVFAELFEALGCSVRVRIGGMPRGRKRKAA